MKSHQTPISKTQIRAMALLGIEPGHCYACAAEALTAKLGYGMSEIPVGHTWRTIAKLSDADYLALLTAPVDLDRFETETIERY